MNINPNHVQGCHYQTIVSIHLIIFFKHGGAIKFLDSSVSTWSVFFGNHPLMSNPTQSLSWLDTNNKCNWIWNVKIFKHHHSRICTAMYSLHRALDNDLLVSKSPQSLMWSNTTNNWDELLKCADFQQDHIQICNAMYSFMRV